MLLVIRTVVQLLLILGVTTSLLSFRTQGPAQPLTFLGFDSSKLSTEAAQGLNENYSGRCFHGGVSLRTVSVASELMTVPFNPIEPPSFAKAAYLDVDTTLPSPSSRSAVAMLGLPLGSSLKPRRGLILFNGNCFQCHAGIVRGEVVAGLGNTRTDEVVESHRMAALLDQHDLIVAQLKSKAEKKEFIEFMEHVRVVGSTFRFAETRGDNFGPYAVWKLGTRLSEPEQKGLNFSPTPTDLEKEFDQMELPTVDPMPWWLMKYKTKSYWYADAGPHDAAHFAFNFTTLHPEANQNRAKHVQTVKTALDFARSTVSPSFPKSLDPTLVKRGADLFHGRLTPTNREGFVTCSQCHGRYERQPGADDGSNAGSWEVTYPYSQRLHDVDTDSAYSDTLRRLGPVRDQIAKLDVFFRQRKQPELAPQVSIPADRGYIAPPLVGVWASAPYFHNGSVPTLESVLDSSARPKIWVRNWGDLGAYDLEKVGLEYRALTEEECDESASTAAKADFQTRAAAYHRGIYDTRRFGRSNQGHSFGDSLSPDERASMLEFLKSLSGGDMSPNASASEG